MLKTVQGDQVWFITQPDHGQLAGTLAAHWGNHEFAAPGHYSSLPDPERLRGETILAIGEHDNGWWEWEASPELSPDDGLPLGLGELLKNQQAGMDRWRLGVERFADAHPYVSLLISAHAAWLYRARADPNPDPAFIHPLFWNRSPNALYSGAPQQDRKFIEDLEAQQALWTARLAQAPETASRLAPENLHPHIRLLQLLDGLSLALCSSAIPAREGEANGLAGDEFDLPDTPRRSWDDRVTIRVQPAGERTLALDPYPFDKDELSVTVPVRILPRGAKPQGAFQPWWRSLPMQQATFQLVRRR